MYSISYLRKAFRGSLFKISLRLVHIICFLRDKLCSVKKSIFTMSRPKVRVVQGELEGIESVTKEGKKYYSFMGIPYAQPPVGDLRFKDPLLPDPWEGVKDASEEGNISPQFDGETKKCIGDEDCLFLNVHTPHLQHTGPNRLPVMIYIHGGAFNFGSGNRSEFGPEYIIEKDCILVSLNYRLGVLGFLCLDAAFAPGNMGLKDQRLAIEWIRDNIGAFNGNSQNITLFGISAGACSIESHLLSSLSGGLFQKAILQSGSVLNPFMLARDHLDNPIRLAQSLGKTLKDPKDLYNFLNSKTAEELIIGSTNVITDKHVQRALLCGFTPVVCAIPGYENFLSDMPIDLLKTGNFAKVPTISGFTSKEGIFMKTFYKNETKALLDKGKLIECLPFDFKMNREILDEKIKSIYRPRHDDINQDDYILDYLTDLVIHGGLCKSTDLRLKHHSDEYFYCFSYDGKMNFLKTKAGFKEKGATHADDQTYLGTNQSVKASNALPKDVVVRKQMVQMWTDFAKTGDPTPQITDDVKVKWLPLSKDKFRLLSIGEELTMEDDDPYFERRELWMKIYDTYE